MTRGGGSCIEVGFPFRREGLFDKEVFCGGPTAERGGEFLFLCGG